ncbi:MAG: YesL family protein [Clostridia bacterium]|nr:YesL family protein [Clostridia bacterium]
MMAKFITKESRPGPGISKDAPEKRRFFLFFEVIGTKFTKLIQLNFIYILTLIPLLFGLYFSVNINTANFGKEPLFQINPDYISIIVLVASVFVTGPATAGFVYVLRNMQRREHAWVWSDFWTQYKRNFKQGTAMAAIDLICYTLLYVAFNFYMFIMPQDMPQMGNMMPYLASGVVALITIVFTWAHFYIYTMMVTFELKLSKILKNSFIFALGKVPLNIFITIVIGAILWGCLYVLLYIPFLAALIFGTVLVSLIGLIIVFSTYSVIDKIMLKRANEEKKRVLKY